MVSPNSKRIESKSSSDLYITPKEALYAIFPYVNADVTAIAKTDLEPRLLEPCQGLGDIVDFFDNNLDSCVSFETNELYPCEDESKLLYKNTYTCDFLNDNTDLAKRKGSFAMILANPPYTKATEFVLKGFEYAPIQWHFLRLNFLEGQKRYYQLLSMGKLTDVYIFTYRVSCDKGYDREETANSVCYAWFRWDNNYSGSPRLHWLTKGE
jgi:hypothetical protein